MSILEPVLKFKPERPIYLNESNTGFKTKIEVLFAIEKLRAKHWLCAYNEKSRPFHMSFNDEKEFQDFKKDCKDLDIVLKSPIIKEEDIMDLDLEESKTGHEAELELTSTSESPEGKIEINTDIKPDKKKK